MHTIQPGLSAEKTITVTENHTAIAFGSGSVPVFGTPALVALMETAAVAALDPLLPEGQASVGVALEIEHLAPTPVGAQVRARAEVTEVDGRRVYFKLQAWDEQELIGEGVHARVVIDVTRFMGRVGAKSK